MFVIRVMLLQSSKLFKGLECTVLAMVLCTIKNHLRLSKTLRYCSSIFLSRYCHDCGESDVTQYSLIYFGRLRVSQTAHTSPHRCLSAPTPPLLWDVTTYAPADQRTSSRTVLCKPTNHKRITIGWKRNWEKCDSARLYNIGRRTAVYV